jgi:hypothetical protein
MERASQVNGRELEASPGRLQFAAILFFGDITSVVMVRLAVLIDRKYRIAAWGGNDFLN